MASSVFEMFRLGIGPSSGHTVGPMCAALLFVRELACTEALEETVRVRYELMGSLGATGKGHATDRAVILGLSGMVPATVSASQSAEIDQRTQAEKALLLNGTKRITFDEDRDIVFFA